MCTFSAMSLGSPWCVSPYLVIRFPQETTQHLADRAWWLWPVLAVAAFVVVYSIAALLVYAKTGWDNRRVGGPVVSGTARVLAATTTLLIVPKLGKRLYRLEVQVDIPGGEPFDVTRHKFWGLFSQPAAPVGVVYPVEASTGNPRRFRVLWDTPIPEPLGHSELRDVQTTEHVNTSGNPLGLIVLMAGAAAMASSVFVLWPFLFVALAIAFLGYRAYRNPADWSLPFWCSLIAMLYVGGPLSVRAFAVMMDPRSVRPVSATVIHAFFLVGFGCVLALVGSLMLRRRAGSGQGGPAGGTLPVRAHTYKKCPDCAQIIPAEAAVCKVRFVK